MKEIIKILADCEVLFSSESLRRIQRAIDKGWATNNLDIAAIRKLINDELRERRPCHGE